LNLDYKIEPTSDHVTKFNGDRPRELGDLALKKRTSAVKERERERERERDRELYLPQNNTNSNATSNTKMSMWQAARRGYRPSSWPPYKIDK